MAGTRTATTRAAIVAAVWAGAILLPDVDSEAIDRTTERLNVKPSGGQSALGATGLFPSVNRDGSRVAFSSAAADLVAGDKDKGGFGHVFMRDRDTDKTRLISTSSKGVPGNAKSYFPLISGNGKVVTFVSEASNLVPNDDNDLPDVFIKILKTDRTILVSDRKGKSRDSANGQSNVAAGISDDGHSVVFISAATNLVTDAQDANNADDVFFWTYNIDDNGLHTKTRLLSHRASGSLATGNAASGGVIGGGDVGGAAISGDGTCAAFGSVATNLVSVTDENGGYPDVFETCGLDKSPTAPQLHLVSKNVDDEQGDYASLYPSLDESGGAVAYFSTSTNLVDNDTNGIGDLFLAYVGFVSWTPTNVAIINLNPDGSQDTGGARFLGSHALSDNGRRVAFTSYGRLAPPTADCGGEQVYLRDTYTQATALISVMTDGTCGDQYSDYASISGDGRWVVWQGAATKLVSNDTNNAFDDFIRGPYG